MNKRQRTYSYRIDAKAEVEVEVVERMNKTICYLKQTIQDMKARHVWDLKMLESKLHGEYMCKTSSKLAELRKQYENSLHKMQEEYYSYIGNLSEKDIPMSMYD